MSHTYLLSIPQLYIWELLLFLGRCLTNWSNSAVSTQTPVCGQVRIYATELLNEYNTMRPNYLIKFRDTWNENMPNYLDPCRFYWVGSIVLVCRKGVKTPPVSWIDGRWSSLATQSRVQSVANKGQDMSFLLSLWCQVASLMATWIPIPDPSVWSTGRRMYLFWSFIKGAQYIRQVASGGSASKGLKQMQCEHY